MVLILNVPYILFPPFVASIISKNILYVIAFYLFLGNKKEMTKHFLHELSQLFLIFFQSHGV